MQVWKLCASTTFEILPFSTCTLCQKKSYTSKSVQPIFKIFASARRCWWWAFGWKVLGAQVVYFCNGKAKTLHFDNIWNFATFNLYTVPAKILHFQKCATDFRNLCLGSKIFRMVIWVESFRCAGILLLQWQLGENFAHRQHLKFCHFQPVHCACKILLLKKYSTDFRNLCLRSKILRVGIWVESFRCAVILLLQWQGKTLRIDNIRNFATFNLYTVVAQIIHLQRYSTDFRNLCLGSKMFRVVIWVESFRCAGVLLLQWQGEKFAHRQHLKFCCTFIRYTVQCGCKNPTSPKGFIRFSKSLPQLEDV